MTNYTEIEITKEIIGDQLAEDLGIALNEYYVDGNYFVIKKKYDKTQAEKILEQYKIRPFPPSPKKSAVAKLIALGLTEDEIAAL